MREIRRELLGELLRYAKEAARRRRQRRRGTQWTLKRVLFPAIEFSHPVVDAGDVATPCVPGAAAEAVLRVRTHPISIRVPMSQTFRPASMSRRDERMQSGRGWHAPVSSACTATAVPLDEVVAVMALARR